MIQLVTPDMRDTFENFVKEHPKGHFCQSFLWAQVKSGWRHEALLSIDDQGQIKGALSLLIRKAPFLPVSILYAPRGPVCDVHDHDTLKDLLEGAKQAARRHRGYLFKIDPDVKADDTVFSGALTEMGFSVKTGLGFEGVQPRFVFRLFLQGRSEEELLASFHSKTRYNIRLAIRSGVTVRVAGREELAAFHEIMVTTGLRDNFVTRNLAYFEKMYDVMAPEHLRLYMAYYEDKPVAGSIAIRYGDKVWYLYGASSNESRHVMPNYLLQWEMIRWAVESGSRIYDFRGVSGDLREENPLYGLYRFKKGFMGEFTEFIGDADYILNPSVYRLVTSGEKVYKSVRRKLYKLRGGKI